MRRAFREVIGLAVVGGCAVVVVSLIRSGEAGLALDAYVLFLGALALLALTRVTRALTRDEDGPSELESFLRPQQKKRVPEEQMPSLARLEREVTLSVARAFDLHQRLRPALREIAEHRLLDRHGVSATEQPERARGLVGETAWEIIRPDRPLPSNRHAAGIHQSELEEIVDTLERL
jgi:hypothetical protein